MPRFPRNYLKTSFFHVMSQGINKNFIFEDSIDIKFYIKNMYEIKDKCQKGRGILAHIKIFLS